MLQSIEVALVQYWQVMPSDNDATDREAIEVCLQAITQSLQNGQYIVAAFAYEVGKTIHKLPRKIPTGNSPHSSKHGLLMAFKNSLKKM
ncbi:hypothetical protein [Polynucleobacter necessarius]|uniref:hypothetical protein n=1 Tax=Polynucleobacter necessarius TaxID=576610 RepID=UPI000E090AD4|nr:hypothetical protein [Polynucleobacter necessarius]